MSSDQYRIRPYEAADRDGFLALYDAVWGHAKGPGWFDWRFRDNPYRDGVQMVVAEHEDRLVGAEPLLPFRLRIGSRTVDAYQPVDWIVHPDHRRRGLFTRMTEHLLECYRDDAALLFNFPNDALLPGLKQFDWREVGTIPTGYRVQNPRALLADSLDSTASVALQPALTVATGLTKQALTLLDRVNAPSDGPAVETYAGVATAPVEQLYSSSPPDRIHVPRDTSFLDWRFDNPRWTTTTYVASRDGEPVATLVAASEYHGGSTATMLLDVQHVAGTPAASSAVETLFVRLLRDNRGADAVKVPGWFDPRLRRRYGFCNDTTISLTSLPSVSTAAVRPLCPDSDLNAAAPWSIDGWDLTDADNWLFTLADLDIE